ncbi:MAG: hypothetical protein Kow00121_51980 [Elainellaceae cyanobacterium]
MQWQEGQRVECDGLDWGSCYVTMCNKNMVVVYCPRYEIVTTGSPTQLEQAGWRPIKSSKVVSISDWSRNDRHSRNPSPVH